MWLHRADGLRQDTGERKKNSACGAAREGSRTQRGIFLRTTKNGKPIKLPLHPDLQATLDLQPAPQAGVGNASISSGAATAPRGR